MARIFNILFQHEGHSYSALVTVSGKRDHENIKVSTLNGQIQISLGNGRLMVPISEVMHHVTASRLRGKEESVFRITDTISLQLLHTNW